MIIGQRMLCLLSEKRFEHELVMVACVGVVFFLLDIMVIMC